MRKILNKLTILILSALLFTFGLGWVVFAKTNKPFGLGCIALATIVFLVISVLTMIRARYKFGIKPKVVLKIIISIIGFVLFTIGLGLFLVTGMIVLGIVLAAIGLIIIIFLIPMFVAFVRANPFEHVIITPNYDDIDTEFFIDKDED